MPTIRAFVDTNVLLYAASTNPIGAEKRRVAREIIGAGHMGISVQVAQEFFVNATRKLTPPLTGAEALGFLQTVASSEVVALDLRLFQEAVRLHIRFRISYWDAAIVAAAKQLVASTLYSEDLTDGQDFEGVQVVNPFRVGFKVAAE